jgi:hypothetical protein
MPKLTVRNDKAPEGFRGLSGGGGLMAASVYFLRFAALRFAGLRFAAVALPPRLPRVAAHELRAELLRFFFVAIC